MKNKQILCKILIFVVILFLLSGVIFSFFKNKNLKKENLNQVNLIVKQKKEIKQKKENINKLKKENNEKEKKINQQNSDIKSLSEQLEGKNTELSGLAKKIEKIQKNLGIIEKLQKTDKELLAKYSKVYFLNEHYTPKNLVDIDEKYLVNSKTLQLKKEVYKYLKKMIEDAKDDNIDFKIISAYRSFEYQTNLKKRMENIYGKKYADSLVADQGLSEHQLGTTVDIVGSDGSMDNFEKSDGYKWMQNNAYKYGFILSYPKDNGYYKFEFWHWRFVGKKLAKYLHKEKKNFYDLPQREINEYLVDLFD